MTSPTTPRDAIGLSDRLRERAATRNTPRRVSDRDYETMGYYTATSAEIDREAATQLDALQARVKELEAARMGQIDYSVDLQRVIEGLCHGRTIREPQTGARHHYDMAIKYQARATRAEQERDEAYERAAKVAEDNTPRKFEGTLAAHVTGNRIAAAIRRLATGPEKEKQNAGD